MNSNNFNLKYIIIDKRLAIVGSNIKFENENLFDLKVGQKISQLGNGKNNGTIRTDNFQNPIEYVGSILCQFNTPEKMFAFQIPTSIDNIYLLYGSTGEEIFAESLNSLKTKSSSMRFYKPIFKIINN